MIDHGIKSRALKNTPCTASGTFFKGIMTNLQLEKIVLDLLISLRFINRSVS